MTNEIFLKHINEVLIQSELSQIERKQLEYLLKRLLMNHTPEELAQLLLRIIKTMHKK
ncbi:TPA: hypothetical protein ACF1UQ_002450 [Enterococcus hirae]